MAKEVAKDWSFYVGALDLSSNINQVSVDASAPELDTTNFDSAGIYECLGGLKSVAFGFQGFWESAGSVGNPDSAIYTDTAALTATTITTAKTNPVAMGDVCYFASGLQTQYTLGATVGAVARLSLSAKGVAPLLRGSILEHNTGRTATGSSTEYELGAVSATQRLYLALHVYSASGTNPTLDILIESDTTGFASATTRITVPQITGISSYYTSVAGAITDTFYRVTATIGGTDTPTFGYVASLAIL